MPEELLGQLKTSLNPPETSVSKAEITWRSHASKNMWITDVLWRRKPLVLLKQLIMTANS